MAVDVNETLRHIIMSEAKLTSQEAEAFLKILEKERRYQKDVWL